MIESVETFTLRECANLQYDFWKLKSTTLSASRSALYDRLETIFAALGNDTDAIILRIKEDSDERNES